MLILVGELFINNLLGWFDMGKKDNNSNGEERRDHERRTDKDRRDVVRFEDVLGRRTGSERREECLEKLANWFTSDHSLWLLLE